MLHLMTVDPPPPPPIAEPAEPSGPADPSGPATEQPPRRLGVVRSVRDRYVAGVAGGAAERFHVDPLFIRLGLVGLTLLLGREEGPAFLPVIAYFLAWLILPTESDRSLLRRIQRRSAQQEAAGAAAVLVLALLVLSRPSLIWAGILFAVAVAMLTDRGRSVEAPIADPTKATPVPQTVAPADRARTWGRSLRGAPLSERGSRVQAPRRPARSPKLWPLTASLLFAYAFGCVLLDNLLTNGVDPGVAVNGALLIVGAVMLLSGWRGRAWITLLLVLPLIPLWFAFSVAGIDRMPDQPFVAAPDGYEDGDVLQASVGYGGLFVDLRRAGLPSSGELTVEVAVTAGQIDVWVPKEAEIRLTGDVGVAEIDVYREAGWYSDTGDRLANWKLNRSYPALGRECFDHYADDISLRFVADISNVDTSPTATAAEIADDIEGAGYPRPLLEVAEEVTPLFDEATGEMLFDVRTGEPIFQPILLNQWIYQSNENGGLCIPETAPEDPLVITIDATVGIGNLKVHRV